MDNVVAALTREIGRMRAAGVPVGEDDLRGLYIPEVEADRLLEEIARRRREPSPGRLDALSRACGLSALETSVIALCFACEIDPSIERLIAYAQDDVSKKRPRVDLALRLASEAPEASLATFDASAPLRRHHLLVVSEEPGQPWTPLPARTIALEPRILRYLTGGDAIDEQLLGSVTLRKVGGGQPHVPEAAALAALPATRLEPPFAVLQGTDAGQLRAAAAALAAGAGLPAVLECDLDAMKDPPAAIAAAIARAGREAALQGAVLLLMGGGSLTNSEARRVKAAVIESAAPLGIICFDATPRVPAPLVAVPPLDFDGRLAAWHQALAGQAREDLASGLLEDLSGKFRLSSEAISGAVEAARGMALSRNPAGPLISAADLYTAARSQSAPILSTLARKVTPHYTWDDLILGPDPVQQLREFAAMLQHRHQVFDVWGFDRKLAMGKGVIALFAGPSGTGKTMAADVLASALGLDLYKIDLSGVVSKYIGETEKNIGAIFDNAEQSNAVLLFDEADALFGKRSEVKDAHDRYANIETAYLLQRMEEYSGAVILSTNLKMNLDEAFMRRMQFVVDFPMPEEADRLRIWESTIPPEADRDPDLDLPFMARQFRISGGNIRNIVLASAFLAAEERSAIAMRHLIRATRREFQKLGRLVTEAEFGEHITYLR